MPRAITARRTPGASPSSSPTPGCPIQSRISADRDWEAIARDYVAGADSVAKICARHAISKSALYDHARKLQWPMRGRNAPAVATATVMCGPKQVAEKCPAVFREKPATKQKPKRTKRWRGQASLLRASHRTIRDDLRTYPQLEQKEGAAPRARLKARRSKPRGIRRADLAQRLMRALDAKVAEFEQRHTAAIAEGAPPSAADAERDARTLNTMVRLFDKLSAIAERDALAHKRGKPAPAAPAQPLEGAADDADLVCLALARRLEALRSALPD